MVQTIENPLFDVASERFPDQTNNDRDNNNTIQNIDVGSKQTDNPKITKFRGLPLLAIMGLILLGILAFVIAFAVCVPLLKKRLVDEAAYKDLQKRFNQTQEDLVVMNVTVHRLREELGEKEENVFKLKEKLIEANEVVAAAERQLLLFNATVQRLREEVGEKEESIFKLHRKEVELSIEIHKLKNPHLKLFCSPDVELCYFGNFDNSSSFDDAVSNCQFPQEGQLLAEPRSKVAVEYLLELTGELHLSNVILGATRGGDSSYRWLSDDSIIENPEWGHDAPFPPHKDCDKVVMTNFEGEWAWFSAYNDQKNFNYFCQQSIYG